MGRTEIRTLLYAIVTACSYMLLFIAMKILVSGRNPAPSCENEPMQYTRPHSSERNTVGLILARGGSKGIKKKNLVKIGNVTLIGRSLRTIHEFGGFSSVWVSTDSVEIAGEAKANGALIHWRSKESATDTAPSILGVKEFLTQHKGMDR